MRQILLVAAENSAENYALQVVAASSRSPEPVHFFGVGGDRLAAAGVEILVHSRELGVVGIVEVLARIRKILKRLDLLFRSARERRADAALLVDYPDFNLKLARKCKKAGIPVYYYISPTVWAWRYSRVKLIRRWVDHLFIIFPFERMIYEKERIPHTYTGHPLLTMVRADEKPAGVRARLGIPADRKLLLLFPGSRRQEVQALLPAMLKAVRLLDARLPVTTVIVRARDIDEQWLRRFLTPGEALLAAQEERWNLLAAADAVLTTCGTANLEMALVGAPFVAVYRVSWLSYILGKWLVRIKRYSIVNILAGKGIVPELIQGRCRSALMAAALERLLLDPQARQEMVSGFAGIRVGLTLERPPADIIWERIAADLGIGR